MFSILKIYSTFQLAGPILESNGMGAIFQKKGKIFQNLGEKVQSWKYFQKGQADSMR